MANAVVNRQVNVYINSGEAAKAYDVLIKREKLLNAELAKTADPKRIKALTAELDKLKDPIERAAKKMKGELAPSIRELELATRKFLNEFKKTGSPEALANFQKFRAQLAKAKADIGGLETSSKGLTSKGIFSGAFWGSFLAGGVTAALQGLGDLFRGSIQEALDADAATRRLESTLDNLGRSDAFDRISRKADEMAAKFRYLDNDDIVAVFNKLIDYGKLTEKEMNDLLPVIIDFAAKSQVSIDESASVIIKALEGNGKALKEYGIDIKDAGSDTERFNVIMTTLKEKVEGSGEAFQNSAAGGILTARQELKNLQEEIGNLVIPALNKLLNFVINAIKKVKEFFFSIKDGFRDSFRINVIDRTIKRAIERNNTGEADAALEAAQKAFDEEQVKRQDEINKKLGVDGGGNKIPKVVIPKIEKEVENFINGIKDIGSVYWKTFLDKMADISKKGKVSANGIDIEKSIAGTIANITASSNRSTLAFLDLKVLTSRGKARLQAQLALLKEEERQELQVKGVTENEKLLIEEQYRIKRKEAEDGYLAGLVENIANYAAQALSIFTMFGDIKTQQENAELERDRQLNEKKHRNLERRLKAGSITRLQYDKEVQKIEREQEKREKEVALKQFKRQQRADITQALINGALAVTSTLAAKPGALDILSLATFRAVNIGLAIATTAGQIAKIASQKPPQFAAGGRLGGRSHASGGNAVIDGQGRKIAEVEAGEGIVNKRTMADRRQVSVSGTPGQIISRLNSLYGTAWEGGATLVPGWRSYSPQRMNYNAMKGIYAAGGQFSTENSGGSASQGAIFENFSALLSDMQATNQYLANILANGIKADVSLIRFEEQQDRLAAIRRDATMVP